MTSPIDLLTTAGRTAFQRRMQDREPILFLDYDGTLTPIVNNPAAAVLEPEMRQVLRALAAQYKVALVSGRELETLRNFVQLDNVYYAGSHGFDIVGPGGLAKQHQEGERCLESLAEATAELESELKGVRGCEIEKKAFATAVHYRNVPEPQVEPVRRAVEETVRRHGKLRLGGGKKVFELRPDVDWDKGRAVLWLWQELSPQAETTMPVYIGDDLTDEDAFRALAGKGVGIYVGELERPTAASFHLTDVDQVKEFLESLL